MLVLSRKQGERIVIGGNIVITVISGGSDRVRLGISAPPHVAIHREEIIRQINASTAESQMAAQSSYCSECA